mgnify:CR=1 FL=1
MSFAPDWMPNVHPLIVHFPIGLLTAAAAVDLVSLFMHQRSDVREAATWLYIVGAAVAVIAYFSGHRAAESMMLPLPISEVVNTHADWAFRTTWSFAFFASLRLALSYLLQPKLPLLVGSFLVALVGIGMLLETVEHGGQLVFEYGLGVQAIFPDGMVQTLVDTSGGFSIESEVPK